MSKETALKLVITQYPATRDSRYRAITGVAVAVQGQIIWLANFRSLRGGEARDLGYGLISVVGLHRGLKCVTFHRQHNGQLIPIGTAFQFATIYADGSIRDPAGVITAEMVNQYSSAVELVEVEKQIEALEVERSNLLTEIFETGRTEEQRDPVVNRAFKNCFSGCPEKTENSARNLYNISVQCPGRLTKYLAPLIDAIGVCDGGTAFLLVRTLARMTSDSAILELSRILSGIGALRYSTQDRESIPCIMVDIAANLDPRKAVILSEMLCLKNASDDFRANAAKALCAYRRKPDIINQLRTQDIFEALEELSKNDIKRIQRLVQPLSKLLNGL